MMVGVTIARTGHTRADVAKHRASVAADLIVRLGHSRLIAQPGIVCIQMITSLSTVVKRIEKHATKWLNKKQSPANAAGRCGAPMRGLAGKDSRPHCAAENFSMVSYS
jgi:hypothetical protein